MAVKKRRAAAYAAAAVACASALVAISHTDLGRRLLSQKRRTQVVGLAKGLKKKARNWRKK